MLDPVGYLTSFGWKGQGNGLHHGSASRPLAIPKKRTLAGLGKDRDDAFPFWDHLFDAAAKSIQIKISDNDEAQIETDPSAQPPLLRTKTGILSNRRPILGTPPLSLGTQHANPHLNLMVTAKRDCARKRLYATFARGSVLRPDANLDNAAAADVTTQTDVVTVAPLLDSDQNDLNQPRQAKKRKRKHDVNPPDEGKRKKKGRRHHDLQTTVGESSRIVVTQETHEKDTHNKDDHHTGTAKLEERHRGEEIVKAESSKKEKSRKVEKTKKKVKEKRGKH